MEHAYDNFNKISRDLIDLASLLENVDSAVLQLAQEAKEESMLTVDDGQRMLSMMDQVEKAKGSFMDTAEALKTAKEKAIREEDMDIEGCFNRALDDQQNREGNDEKSDTIRQLEALLQGEDESEVTDLVAQREADANVSLVMEGDGSSQPSQVCPITRQPITNACRNRHCNHVFEKEAAIRYIKDIRRLRQALKCPLGGCQNKKFTESDLEDVAAPQQEPCTQEF